ncbi:peptidase domain containing protein [Methylobacterium platani]|uniref:Murein endopeptidase K n=1 Tax=Methylobacterium platani TaxID=427683 RepID=A0A179S889_9HYPH|nr:peptidase domain containing protein [Methylobacterium platani]
MALVACLAAMIGSTSDTQDAVANGDTRTISIFHEHTKESAAITFKRDGRYDRAALEQLNWLLRDWRLDEPTRMDPRLFDVVWEAHRAVGSQDAIHVVSAYRSPKTNAALRRRSRAVAEHSQHMLGKAMDFYLADVSIDQIRAIGMQMQRGGVGWYPHANSPFVHLDVGSVRSWPRMSHDQLARLFPDGRTVHLPADGRPMPGYEMAKAEILSRGGSVMGVSQAIAAADEEDSPNVVGQFFAMLFGGSKPAAPAPAPVVLSGRAGRVRPVALASAAPEDAGTRNALAYADAAAPAALLPQAASRQAALPPAQEPAPRETVPQEAAPTAAAPEPDTVAGPAASGRPAAPLPPRRPSEFAALAEALVAAPPPVSVPLPPARPGSVKVASAEADPAALGALLHPHLRSGPAAPSPAEPRSSDAKASDPKASDPKASDAKPSDSKAQLRALFSAATAAPAAEAATVHLVQRAKPGTPPAGLVSAPAGTVATRFKPKAADDVPAGRFAGPAVGRR